MCKQDMNTQLMRKLISHVFTQDMTTWKHAADRNTNCVQHNKTHVDKSARCRANSRPRTHNDRKWSASVRTPSRDRNSRHECRDPNTTLQHETRHADERARDSSTLEAARSHENADIMGVSGLCHKTMNNTRPKWQNPDSYWLLCVSWSIVSCYGTGVFFWMRCEHVNGAGSFSAIKTLCFTLFFT